MTFCEEAKDDDSILDSDLLVRAIHPNHWVKVLGATTMRPVSVGFNESSDGTGASANLWSILQQHQLPKVFVAASLAAKRADHGFVEFLTELPRSFGAKIVRDPEDDNPAHVVMCGLSDDAKSSLSRRSTVLSLGKPKTRQ